MIRGQIHDREFAHDDAFYVAQLIGLFGKGEAEVIATEELELLVGSKG